MTARLNETRFGPKKVVPNISRPKKSRHFLLHWMSVKLTDNFQMREHSWPCRFHIIFSPASDGSSLYTITNIEVVYLLYTSVPTLFKPFQSQLLGHSRYPANNLVCNSRINRTTFHMSVT
jgi:hypothetical protein